MTIPKVIHYCWVGGKPLTPLAQKCLDSWRYFCPEYKIIRWDESNYNFAKHPYMKQAYEAKMWGFVPDYARLDIIYQHGGIYLDTDVEIIKPLDDLLIDNFFAGFESREIIALGLGFGAEAHHTVLKGMMDDYDNYAFTNADGSLNLLPSPQIQTKFLRKYYHIKDDNGKIQKMKEITIYPKEYFCPKDFLTGKINITDHTYSIHHYASSWFTIRGHIEIFLIRKAPLCYKILKWIVNVLSLKKLF